MAVSTAQNAEVGEITERVLDAALACFARAGVRRTTMNSIADQAGVGVATVYRRFPKKEQLLQAVLVREATRLLDAVQCAIADVQTYDEQMVVGFVTFTQELARRTLLRKAAAPDVGSPIDLKLRATGVRKRRAADETGPPTVVGEPGRPANDV